MYRRSPHGQRIATLSVNILISLEFATSIGLSLTASQINTFLQCSRVNNATQWFQVCIARQTEVAAQVSQKISCISLGTEQALRPVITVVFTYKISVHIDKWTNTFITNPQLRDRLSKVCSSPSKCALAGGARCIQDPQWLYRSLHEDMAVGSKSIKKLLFQLVIQSSSPDNPSQSR